jgi:hypothetical protein
MGCPLSPLHKFWQLDFQCRETIEEVIAEFFCHYHLAEVAVRCGDHPNIDLESHRGSDTLNFILLDGAKPFCLSAGWDFTNFAQKKGPASANSKYLFWSCTARDSIEPTAKREVDFLGSMRWELVPSGASTPNRLPPSAFV